MEINTTLKLHLDCLDFIYSKMKLSRYTDFMSLATSYACLGIGFLSIFGNSMFLYIMFFVKRERTTFELLLVLLAFTDLLVGVVIIPIYITIGIMFYFQPDSCELGTLVMVSSRLTFIHGVMSLWLVANLAVDRLLAVLYPLRRLSWNLKKLYKIATTVMFVFVLVMGVISTQFEIKYIGRAATSVAITLIILIIVCYVKIYLKIKQHDRERDSMSVTAATATSRKKKTAKLGALITVLLLVFYLPAVLRSVVRDKMVFFRWDRLLVIANSVVNPVVYLFRGEIVREEFERIVQRITQRLCRCFSRAVTPEPLSPAQNAGALDQAGEDGGKETSEGT